MALNALFYLAWLICFGGYALVRGGSPERVAIAVAVAASVASVLVFSPLAKRDLFLETRVMAIDLLVLASFTAIALTANRWWPIWIAAIQLLSVLVHLARALDVHIYPWAYAVAIAAGAYPTIAIVAAGAWRHQSRLARFGADASWKTSSSR